MNDRFWNHVNKTDGCWFWIGYRKPSGYGQYTVCNNPAKNVLCHRYSYELAKGPIPQGLMVRHLCDQKACVNPDHLEVGTHQDNMNDVKARKKQKMIEVYNLGSRPLGLGDGSLEDYVGP